MRAESEHTEIIQGEQQTREAVLRFFAGARTRMDISAASMTQAGSAGSDEITRSLVALKERGVRARLVTEISRKDIEAARLAVQLLEVRHLPGLKATFAVTDGEYLSSPVPGEGARTLPVIYSNAENLVRQHQYIFDTLWNRGEPAGRRIRALESGSDLPEFELMRDSRKIKEVYLSAVRNAKERILLLCPSPGAFHRDERIGVVGDLLAAARRGVDVKLLAPIDQSVLGRLEEGLGKMAKGTFAFRPIPAPETPETVTILVADDALALTIDDDDPMTPEFDLGLGVATLVTQKARMRANIRFFERSWMESELREAERAARQREEASRRRAELMQDILTHDIRNFNQVTRLNAELLQDQVTDKDSKKRVAAILKSVDGSSRLIERTKKLGNILSALSVDLAPVSVKSSLERSLSLVRKGNPERKLLVESRAKGKVLGDPLLDEVFTNLLTNSVRYTEGDPVRIRVDQKEAKLDSEDGKDSVACWKLTFTDWGRGIPDPMKPTVFRRYLETAKGSGLGMSIVHALVSERYGGRVEVRDRVEGDHTQGTKVEVWLRKA